MAQILTAWLDRILAQSIVFAAVDNATVQRPPNVNVLIRAQE
jgi:hypothetical protein